MNKSIPPGYSFFASMVRTYKQAKNPIRTMQESMSRFNGTYTVNLGMMRVIATQDPGLIEYILKSNHRNYHKSQIQTEYLGKFLGKGLLTSNGDYWLKQRRLIQPGFHTEKIHALYATIKRTIDEFLLTIRTGDVDVYPLLHKLAFDIVINTLFTVDVPAAQRQRLATFISDVQEYVIREVRNPHKRWWFQLSGELQKNLNKAADARDLIRSLIRQRLQDKGRHNDLLDMLLEARYEESGQPMTEEQVIDEILIILIAGHETTANALSWSLYLLAQHPDELQIAKEASKSLALHQVVGNDVLNNVLRESMRLYPPAWISDRVALENDEYANFLIPKGTVIVIFYYGLHRDAKEWSDALSFKPARFSNEDNRDIKKIYYPFGAGPRLCIGNNFAMAEMAIFLQSFIQMFHVEPGNIEPTLKPLVTLRPDKVMLKVTKVV
jgi:cytochrome P450